jgi:glycosyltransferase involved in cell wall biosynthesis
MTMDNCWSATPKQRLGSMIAQWYVRPLADAIWVPGERQAVFARRLGFEERAIIRGLYSCDQPNLESVYCSRIAHHQPVQHSFLYLGRFVPEKGLDKLVEAYQSYRTKSNAPWPLVCYGAGPLRSYLEGNAGIRVEGFVQPDQLGAALSKAGCLVLPSTFEPWGVVVHEAASAGLLILASQNVGAAVHLVQDYYNGFLCDGKDTDHLSTLMAYVSSLDGEKLEAMSRASHSLSKQYSPRRWADALLQGFRAAARN